MYKLLCLVSTALFACVDHPATDSREFFCEVLDNGVTLLIVEDSNASESAAAMLVDVGSNDNPEGREGLAHFLEHMLFIATEEYPEVDSLSDYVSAHGGSYNAFTAEDKTQYYFSVKPDYFEKGFDIFSAFFIHPLFPEKYVERERHAVHAEFIKSKEDDDWRLQHLLKAVLSPHPANRFSVGNLDTLGISGLRDDLIDFYNTHYTARNMYCVVVVPDNADYYLSVVKQRLSKIQDKSSLEHNQTKRIASGDTGRVVYYQSIKDIQEMNISFVIPSQKSHYMKHSGQYIAMLLGDEGEGSIIQALRQEDLATSLSVGVADISASEASLFMNLKLTDNGIENQDKIISAILSYIQLVAEQGIEEFRYHEMQRIDFLDYSYYNQQSALHQVNQLVGHMRDFPPHKWYNVAYVLPDSVFDKAHILNILNRLTLDNAIITFVSQSVSTDQHEPIYGIDYAVRSINADEYKIWTQKSDFDLALPKPNTFIPSSIQLMDTEDTEEPLHLARSSWYKKGLFSQPKQFLRSTKIFPAESVEDIVQLQMMVSLLKQDVLSKLYPALLAGSDVSVDYDDQGILLNVSGIGDKQPLVLDKSLELLSNLQAVSQQDFEQVKDAQLRRLNSLKQSEPISWLFYQLNVLVCPQKYDSSEMIEVLESLTVEKFRESVGTFLSGAKESRFYYGNVLQSDIKLLTDSIQVDVDPVVLEEKEAFYESLRSDQAVLMYYQMHSDSDKDRLCALLISKMLHPDFFRILRTEEQLGYIVGVTYQVLDNWPGIAFMVQSPNVEATTLKERVEHFINEEISWDEEAFESIKQSLILSIEEPFKTMDQEFVFYATQIHNGQFDFNLKSRMAAVLKEVSLEDVQSTYHHLIQSTRKASLMTQ